MQHQIGPIASGGDRDGLVGDADPLFRIVAFHDLDQKLGVARLGGAVHQLDPDRRPAIVFGLDERIGDVGFIGGDQGDSFEKAVKRERVGF